MKRRHWRIYWTNAEGRPLPVSETRFGTSFDVAEWAREFVMSGRRVRNYGGGQGSQVFGYIAEPIS